MYNDEDRSIFDVFEADTTESTPINTAWQSNHEEFKDFDNLTDFSPRPSAANFDAEQNILDEAAKVDSEEKALDLYKTVLGGDPNEIEDEIKAGKVQEIVDGKIKRDIGVEAGGNLNNLLLRLAGVSKSKRNLNNSSIQPTYAIAVLDEGNIVIKTADTGVSSVHINFEVYVAKKKVNESTLADGEDAWVCTFSDKKGKLKQSIKSALHKVASAIKNVFNLNKDPVTNGKILITTNKAVFQSCWTTIKNEGKIKNKNGDVPLVDLSYGGISKGKIAVDYTDYEKDTARNILEYLRTDEKYKAAFGSESKASKEEPASSEEEAKNDSGEFAAELRHFVDVKTENGKLGNDWPKLKKLLKDWNEAVEDFALNNDLLDEINQADEDELTPEQLEFVKGWFKKLKYKIDLDDSEKNAEDASKEGTSLLTINDPKPADVTQAVEQVKDEADKEDLEDLEKLEADNKKITAYIEDHSQDCDTVAKLAPVALKGYKQSDSFANLPKDLQALVLNDYLKRLAPDFEGDIVTAKDGKIVVAAAAKETSILSPEQAINVGSHAVADTLQYIQDLADTLASNPDSKEGEEAAVDKSLKDITDDAIANKNKPVDISSEDKKAAQALLSGDLGKKESRKVSKKTLKESINKIKKLQESEADDLVDLMRFDMLEDTVFLDKDELALTGLTRSDLMDCLAEVFPSWAGVDSVEKARTILAQSSKPEAAEYLAMLDTALSNMDAVEKEEF